MCVYVIKISGIIVISYLKFCLVVMADMFQRTHNLMSWTCTEAHGHCWTIHAQHSKQMIQYTNIINLKICAI